jgi:hypothetical protein
LLWSSIIAGSYDIISYATRVGTTAAKVKQSLSSDQNVPPQRMTPV